MGSAQTAPAISKAVATPVATPFKTGLILLVTLIIERFSPLFASIGLPVTVNQ
jgi:hypothetical protein